MSLWLASSASAGASLMVAMKNRDARIALWVALALARCGALSLVRGYGKMQMEF
jgi:hypothetical protein